MNKLWRKRTAAGRQKPDTDIFQYIRNVRFSEISCTRRSIWSGETLLMVSAVQYFPKSSVYQKVEILKNETKIFPANRAISFP